MKINLTKLTDKQLAELRQACDEECLWLCKRRGYNERHDNICVGDERCWDCPAYIAKGKEVFKDPICSLHMYRLITKQQIAAACDAEIANRTAKFGKAE